MRLRSPIAASLALVLLGWGTADAARTRTPAKSQRSGQHPGDAGRPPGTSADFRRVLDHMPSGRLPPSRRSATPSERVARQAGSAAAPELAAQRATPAVQRAIPAAQPSRSSRPGAVRRAIRLLAGKQPGLLRIRGGFRVDPRPMGAQWKAAAISTALGAGASYLALRFGLLHAADGATITEQIKRWSHVGGVGGGFEQGVWQTQRLALHSGEIVLNLARGAANLVGLHALDPALSNVTAKTVAGFGVLSGAASLVLGKITGSRFHALFL